eukprot:4213878-Amphidinium_carterae.1
MYRRIARHRPSLPQARESSIRSAKLVIADRAHGNGRGRRAVGSSVLLAPESIRKNDRCAVLLKMALPLSRSQLIGK